MEIDSPAQMSESTNGGQGMHFYESNLVIDRAAPAGQILFAGPSVGYVSRGGALQRTLDGGANWTLLGTPWSPSPSPAPHPSPSPSPSYFMPTPVQLDAPTRDVVWAYIPLDKVLFVSSDQGNRWEVRNLPPQPDSVTNITFIDATEGWALASIGGTGTCATEQVKIWHTVDGAQTWQSVEAAGISDAQCKLNLLFADRTHAFMASEEENLLPRIYRSTDGGHTWSWTALSDPAGFQSVPDGFAFGAGVVKSFGNTLLVSASGNGFLSGVAGSWVYRSTDGGAHWSEPVTLPTSPGAGQVAFMSATRWLIMQARAAPPRNRPTPE